ncbi:MAG TPA: Asp23/Gls24 family envelope stress response protein [Clostridiales bacterium]|jgi:uncharacterized alkaline shock family protein YloU|nr:Asp23/Gls24 family envelope stress response protein [Clostridiales bacterium]
MKLITKRGAIYITDEVIASICGYAALSCFGVKGMARKSLKDGIICLPKGHFPKGVKIRVENNRIDIELHVVIEHGVNMRTVGQSIMSEVRYTVESVTGVKVNRVDVYIDAVTVSHVN